MLAAATTLPPVASLAGLRLPLVRTRTTEWVGLRDCIRGQPQELTRPRVLCYYFVIRWDNVRALRQTSVGTLTVAVVGSRGRASQELSVLWR